MGCGDACPVFSGKRYLDWELPDPLVKIPGLNAAPRHWRSGISIRPTPSRRMDPSEPRSGPLRVGATGSTRRSTWSSLNIRGAGRCPFPEGPCQRVDPGPGGRVWDVLPTEPHASRGWPPPSRDVSLRAGGSDRARVRSRQHCQVSTGRRPAPRRSARGRRRRAFAGDLGAAVAPDRSAHPSPLVARRSRPRRAGAPPCPPR